VSEMGVNSVSIMTATRTIQVRPSRNPHWQKRGGWEVFEAQGVRPVYLDEHARDSALSYARQRAGYGRAEIQVLDEAWNVVETIGNEEARPLVLTAPLRLFPKNNYPTLDSKNSHAKQLLSKRSVFCSV
jgi:hypothetical protein